MREPCINREYGAHARRIPGTRAALPCARRSGKPDVLARAAEAAQTGPFVQIRSGAGARYLSWVAVTKEELGSASATGKHNTVRVPISDVSQCTRLMMELHSHLPPPLSVGDDGGCFIVRAANGQAVAYIYYFDEDQGNSAGKLVSRDEAEEIAAKIARLPDLP